MLLKHRSNKNFPVRAVEFTPFAIHAENVPSPLRNMAGAVELSGGGCVARHHGGVAGAAEGCGVSVFLVGAANEQHCETLEIA
jgi:hypothetical protein